MSASAVPVPGRRLVEPPRAAANPFAAGSLERRKRRIDVAVALLLGGLTTGIVAVLVYVLVYLFVKAWPALSWRFLTESPSHYMTGGGIWAPMAGTAEVVLLSLLIAAPIGVLAGIYLNEYAHDSWRTRAVNLAVVSLAGVPSIVHALFGVGAFVIGAGFGRSVAAAACTLAIMTLPVIIASTVEALASVPAVFREACWNLGATRWQTIRTIVLPNAGNGILTGVILQVSRAAGETAPILFTGAVAYSSLPDDRLTSLFPYRLNEPFMALSYHLFTITTQVIGVSEARQYATAAVLVALVVAMNGLAILLRAWLRMRRRW